LAAAGAGEDRAAKDAHPVHCEGDPREGPRVCHGRGAAEWEQVECFERVVAQLKEREDREIEGVARHRGPCGDLERGPAAEAYRDGRCDAGREPVFEARNDCPGAIELEAKRGRVDARGARAERHAAQLVASHLEHGAELLPGGAAPAVKAGAEVPRWLFCRARRPGAGAGGAG